MREGLFSLYKSHGGLGIGLYLTHQLIGCLGSELQVESPWAADGSPGTAFSFSVDMASCSAADAAAGAPPTQLTAATLRAAPTLLHGEGEHARAAPPPPAAVAPPPQFAPNLRVLVADDQPTNRRLLRRAFTSFFGEGWAVREASTAEQALELATETAFDVVVMDEIFSPEPGAMRGSAAITRLRSLGGEGGGRPVIIHCTGQTDVCCDGEVCSAGALGRAVGADALWGKPMPSFTNGESSW